MPNFCFSPLELTSGSLGAAGAAGLPHPTPPAAHSASSQPTTNEETVGGPAVSLTSQAPRPAPQVAHSATTEATVNAAASTPALDQPGGARSGHLIQFFMLFRSF